MIKVKALPFIVASILLAFASGCVSSQHVAGKRYNFGAVPGMADKMPGLYTYEKDYTSVNMVQNPSDYVFFSAQDSNIGFGDSSVGNIKTVDGSRHQFLFGLITLKNP